MNTKIIDFILLIPCYNNITGLKNSIKSIHYPALQFEVLIIDDGSTSPITIANLHEANTRVNINIIRLNTNQGILHALNTGLELLKNRNDFKFIARLDAGDICYPQRFYKQVEFLNTHNDVALLGTWSLFVNTVTAKEYNYCTKINHETIVKEMHYKCSFIHPSVMFKKELLDTVGLYPTSFIHVEDYAFFWSILKIYKGAILPEVLVKIYFSNENVSSKNYKLQLINRKKVVGLYATTFIDKQVGLALLNLKLGLPQKLIQQLKYFLKK